MSVISRRDLLYSGLALSASSFVARSAWARTAALATATTDASIQTAMSPREQLLFDFGWKFQLGNGNDPTRDLGFGHGSGSLRQDRRFRFRTCGV